MRILVAQFKLKYFNSVNYFDYYDSYLNKTKNKNENPQNQELWLLKISLLKIYLTGLRILSQEVYFKDRSQLGIEK